MDNKKSFKSPTTPGLFVTFRDYVIELVCLNLRSSLRPRFWKDPKYWGPKYRREIKGMSNLKKRLDNFDDPMWQKAIIESVRKLNIKSLSATKTIAKLEKMVKKQYDEIACRRKELASSAQSIIEDPEEHMQRNANFVDAGKPTKLTKLKEIENRGKAAKD